MMDATNVAHRRTVGSQSNYNMFTSRPLTPANLLAKDDTDNASKPRSIPPLLDLYTTDISHSAPEFSPCSVRSDMSSSTSAASSICTIDELSSPRNFADLTNSPNTTASFSFWASPTNSAETLVDNDVDIADGSLAMLDLSPMNAKYHVPDTDYSSSNMLEEMHTEQAFDVHKGASNPARSLDLTSKDVKRRLFQKSEEDKPILSLSNNSKPTNSITTFTTTPPYQMTHSSILLFPGTYDLNKHEKLGHGAWSNVFLASCSSPNCHNQLIAIKRPLNNYSKPTIYREALILSHVQRTVSFSKRNLALISFYGFDAETGSIVMPAYPGDNLNDLINRRAKALEGTSSNTTLRIPVVGVRQWIFTAERLLDALSFLKANDVIHADIKPHNILLRKVNTAGENAWWGDRTNQDTVEELYEPVLTDFSSGYVLNPDGVIGDDEDPIRAVTTNYCAPELLEAMMTKNVEILPQPLPTFSSDVYALAMTLLHMAIGAHPYSVSRYQQSVWARKGDPLEFARMDERAFKCAKGGIVVKIIEGCFGTKSERRTTVEDMERRVKGLGVEWRDMQAERREAWIWGK